MGEETSDNGMRITAQILTYGDVPPSGGPARSDWLEANGLHALREARETYNNAVTVLGREPTSLPKREAVAENHDENAVRAIQLFKVEEWKGYNARLGLGDQDLAELHEAVMASEKAALTAFNYLEDHPRAEEAHAALHEASFLKRGLFGCRIEFEEDRFWTSCRCRLGHIRRGLSVGMISEFVCTFCGKAIEDCEHVPGIAYEKTASRTEELGCTICGAVDCHHEEGVSYSVVATQEVKNAVLHEVSLVSKPRYPQARIVRMTLDVDQLVTPEMSREMLIKADINCDDDLGPCRGMRTV